jgi:hypothetical protein
MDYNTALPKLIIPEYGRHVQKMAGHLLAINDRKERTRATEALIQTMSQVNPGSKESADSVQKLWDHLHIITEYMLDVDSPYPKPSPDILKAKPEQLSYPATNIRYKHYGKIIADMVNVAKDYKDSPEKDALVEIIACLMKKAYITWNKSTVDANTIVSGLKELSGGKLILKNPAVLEGVVVQIPTQEKPSNFPRKKNKFNKNFGNRNKNRKQNNRNGGF